MTAQVQPGNGRIGPLEREEAIARLREASGVDNPLTSENREDLRTIEEMVRGHYDSRRQEALDLDFHVSDAFVAENAELADELKRWFLEEKKGLNIGETFDLSLREPYFGKIYIVKLASTDHDIPDASKKMFDEMREFMHWLRTEGPLKGVAEGEGYGMSMNVGDDSVPVDVEDKEDYLDRYRSGRWMEYKHFSCRGHGDLYGDRTAIQRIRPFASAKTMVNGIESEMQIFKETVFTIPRSLFEELRGRFNNDIGDTDELSGGADVPIGSNLMTEIERYMYTSAGRGVIQRIHTSIYSATYPFGALDNVD